MELLETWRYSSSPQVTSPLIHPLTVSPSQQRKRRRKSRALPVVLYYESRDNQLFSCSFKASTHNYVLLRLSVFLYCHCSRTENELYLTFARFMNSQRARKIHFNVGYERLKVDRLISLSFRGICELKLRKRFMFGRTNVYICYTGKKQPVA